MQIIQSGPQERSTNEGLWVIAAFIDLAMLVAAVFGRLWLDTSRKWDFIFCIFRRITGHYCPFCGMTRAFTAAMHGDLVTSINENPMGIVLMALGLFITIWQILANCLKIHFAGSFWLKLSKIAGLMLLINWLCLFFIK